VYGCRRGAHASERKKEPSGGEEALGDALRSILRHAERSITLINHVKMGTLHECYTTAVHVDKRRLSIILLNHPSPVEDVRIHGEAGTGDRAGLVSGAAKQ
jgi:hypothetical protein